MNQNNPKISACLIAYKEEIHIKEYLENVSRFADELILVYDGESCEDKTLEMAKDFSEKKNFLVKIFLRPHTGDPEAHRPFSFRQASYDWIFWLDSDERITGNLENLRKFILENPEISRIRFLIGSEKELNNHSSQRRACLFLKQKCFFIGTLGQKISLLEGKSFDYPEDVKIIHLQTRQSFLSLLKKSLKYAKINAKSYFIFIDKIDIFNKNKKVIDDFLKERRKKIKLAPLLIFFSPLRAMINYSRDKRFLKNIISAGFQTFVFYFYLNFLILSSFLRPCPYKTKARGKQKSLPGQQGR